jgi:glycosyltransferase involved in cell wall biosynthesis
MGRFDVFVLPSLQEALPYVILEAAALEKPVVASEVGGIRELLRNEETGLLVPPGDPKTLAAAVIRLAEDPALAASLGKKLRSAGLTIRGCVPIINLNGQAEGRPGP